MSTPTVAAIRLIEEGLGLLDGRSGEVSADDILHAYQAFVRACDILRDGVAAQRAAIFEAPIRGDELPLAAGRWIGPGNNIDLRLRGDQHTTFEDTLP